MIPQDQLVHLNDNMNQRASTGRWQDRFNQSLSDAREMDELCLDGLLRLMRELEETNLKDSVQTHFETRVIKECGDEQRVLLLDGMRKGIVEGDWMTLIELRVLPYPIHHCS